MFNTILVAIDCWLFPKFKRKGSNIEDELYAFINAKSSINYVVKNKNGSEIYKNGNIYGGNSNVSAGYGISVSNNTVSVNTNDVIVKTGEQIINGNKTF